MLLTGEAGVGKSRLLTEITEQAQQEGAPVLLGHCFPTDIDLPTHPYSMRYAPISTAFLLKR